VLACGASLTLAGALAGSPYFVVTGCITTKPSARQITGQLEASAGPESPPSPGGPLLASVFAVHLRWLPTSGLATPGLEHDLVDRARHLILPVVALSLVNIAGWSRFVRSSMLEILDSEFVKLARIKGLSETTVIWKHCLRNALIPVLTLWGVFMAGLVTGAIVTETVFAWPGIGRLTYEAVIFRDFPLLQAVIIMDAVMILIINLVVDILYAYVDPRIRYT
jgi:peptide/nickel transport system permease protein